MNLTILTTHLVLFGLAMLLTTPRGSLVGDLLVFATGAFAFPVFAVICLAMLDPSNHAGNGTTGAWYLIYSIVTLGVVPLVTHLCAVISGMCAGRTRHLFRDWRRRAAASKGVASLG